MTDLGSRSAEVRVLRQKIKRVVKESVSKKKKKKKPERLASVHLLFVHGVGRTFTPETKIPDKVEREGMGTSQSRKFN